MKTITIFTDGGARGNPGPAAIGVIMKTETGIVTHSISRRIGQTTNNIAEYTAVIEALDWLVKNSRDWQNPADSPSIHFFLDSTLVVNQLNGLFKVKDQHLRELLLKARMLEQQIGCSINYTYVPREQNTEADKLVNRALDTPLSR